MDTILQQQAVANIRQKKLIVIKGALAVIWGGSALFIALLKNPLILVYTFGILNIIAAILTFTFTIKNVPIKKSRQWLFLEAIVELVAGITFSFFINDISHFLLYMSYGIMFVVLVQFTYGFVLAMSEIFHPKNLLARLISLIVGCVITVCLVSGAFDHTASFVIIGVFSIIYGVLNIQFAYTLNNIFLGEAN
jgi:uncharacterized membrane protein HdeD (DUF308 family)